MTKRARFAYAPLVALAMVWASAAFAADPPTAAPAEPSREAREQMAAAHQKIADCLRSSRPVAECHAEMKAGGGCMMGDGGCPMMEGGTCPAMKGEGMKHGPGAMHGGAPPQEQKP